MILIKNDKIVLATNTDIEIYALVSLNSSSSSNRLADSFDTSELDGIPPDEISVPSTFTNVKIKELKKYFNVHKDSILCLGQVSDNLFASGSSDGLLIIWQSETLVRTMELRPFDELNLNLSFTRQNLNSITCFLKLFEVNCDFLLYIKKRI